MLRSMLTKQTRADPTPTSSDWQARAPGQEKQENDLSTSVAILSQSFLTWHRLQRCGVVTVGRVREVESLAGAGLDERYPNLFRLLSRGSQCPESIQIGEGKHSRVYQRGNMAYKVVRLNSRSRDPDTVAKLRCNLKELGFFHSLSHPNLMRARRSQMVMEHGSFKRLIHEMTKARCTLTNIIYGHEILCCQDLIFLFRSLVRAVAYLHQNDVTHGDIKPDNVLVTVKGTCLLSDFTLSTMESRRSASMSFGTLFWRAPECARGEDYGPAADVWSLGIVLLDCLFGTLFGADILQVGDNRELLGAIDLLVGGDEVGAQEALRARLTAAKVQVTATEDELNLIYDLAGRILKAEAKERPTCEEILAHPLFRLTGEPMQPLARQPTGCVVQWRDAGERTYLEQEAEAALARLVGVEGKVAGWMVEDAVVMCKRTMDAVRLAQMTMNVENLLTACCKFVLFLWTDYWPATSLQFESWIFHICWILKFRIFPVGIGEVVGVGLDLGKAGMRPLEPFVFST